MSNVWGRTPGDPEWHRLTSPLEADQVTACRLVIRPSSTYLVDETAGIFATPATGKPCAECVDRVRLDDVMRRVSTAFRAWKIALSRLNRCTRADSRALASTACHETELAYRKVALERDRFVEEMRARQTQRGGSPTRDHDGPIITKESP
jgi:hypothetical protein